jgi:hypothetical protein
VKRYKRSRFSQELLAALQNNNTMVELGREVGGALDDKTLKMGSKCVTKKSVFGSRHSCGPVIANRAKPNEERK